MNDINEFTQLIQSFLPVETRNRIHVESASIYYDVNDITEQQLMIFHDTATGLYKVCICCEGEAVPLFKASKFNNTVEDVKELLEKTLTEYINHDIDELTQKQNALKQFIGFAGDENASS